MPETVHQCPPDGGGLMPCCGLTPFEVPRADRITEDEALVTCRRPFLPDWTLAPGDLLAWFLKEHGTDEADLVVYSGLDLEMIRAVLAAETPVTEETAAGLHAATGVPVSFWLDAEAKYRADLARGAKRSPIHPAEAAPETRSPPDGPAKED